MIKSFYEAGTGMTAKFGNGTVRIHSYTLISRPCGQIELSTCDQREVGDRGDSVVSIPNSPKIILDFKTTDSIDVLITKLNDLKEQMEESYGEEEIQEQGTA